ncbi:MAG: hypothetical protein AB1512_10245 [Thermodesulfobacteriota bacterium]
MEDRFGIPASAFDDYLMIEKSRSRWLLRRSPHLKSMLSYKVSSWGMKAFQRVGHFIKPTTRVIQVFGTLATRAVVQLGKGQLQCMIDGKDLYIESALENGYVILALEDHVLGMGLLINGRLRLQIRKSDLKPLSPGLDA